MLQWAAPKKLQPQRNRALHSGCAAKAARRPTMTPAYRSSQSIHKPTANSRQCSDSELSAVSCRLSALLRRSVLAGRLANLVPADELVHLLGQVFDPRFQLEKLVASGEGERMLEAPDHVVPRPTQLGGHFVDR